MVEPFPDGFGLSPWWFALLYLICWADFKLRGFFILKECALLGSTEMSTFLGLVGWNGPFPIRVWLQTYNWDNVSGHCCLGWIYLTELPWTQTTAPQCEVNTNLTVTFLHTPYNQTESTVGSCPCWEVMMNIWSGMLYLTATSNKKKCVTIWDDCFSNTLRKTEANLSSQQLLSQLLTNGGNKSVHIPF